MRMERTDREAFFCWFSLCMSMSECLRRCWSLDWGLDAETGVVKRTPLVHVLAREIVDEEVI